MTSGEWELVSFTAEVYIEIDPRGVIRTCPSHGRYVTTRRSSNVWSSCCTPCRLTSPMINSHSCGSGCPALFPSNRWSRSNPNSSSLALGTKRNYSMASRDISSRRAIVEDGRMACQRILRFGRAVKVQQRERRVHVRLLDRGKHAVRTF